MSQSRYESGRKDKRVLLQPLKEISYKYVKCGEGKARRTDHTIHVCLCVVQNVTKFLHMNIYSVQLFLYAENIFILNL
jgi:hypothetical protein